MKRGKIVLTLASLTLLAGSLLGNVEMQDTPAASIAVPAGPALTEGEIIILLQAKVPVEVIQTFVQTRGAGFQASKDTGRKIVAAGGNVALVGTISLNQKELPAVASSMPDDNKRKK